MSACLPLMQGSWKHKTSWGDNPFPVSELSFLVVLIDLIDYRSLQGILSLQIKRDDYAQKSCNLIGCEPIRASLNKTI